MERITYFKVFGFLAFTGSAFLSTVFHYPVFTVAWFVIMLMFAITLPDEKSELTILSFSVLAYVPLALISVLGNYVSKVPNSANSLSGFACLLISFLIIEFILAIVWLSNR